MEKLSRRDVVTLAGAGIVLAGCKPETPNAEKDARAAGIVARTGYCEDYGASPHDATLPNTISVAFEPPYISVIHLGFDQPATLLVNYASFAVAPTAGDDARLAKAIAVLEERFDPTKPKGYLSELEINPPYSKKDWRDFEHFGFKSQHELFFFFDHKSVSLNEKRLLSFTKYSMTPASTIDENGSFVKAEKVPEARMGATLAGRGKMMRVRNYMIFSDGKPIDAANGDKQLCSMNIHYFTKYAGGKDLPMVIDPDVGNGQGYEP